MFTVLSNTRNSNLYLIAALAIMVIVLSTFAVVPAISAPKPVRVPVTGISKAASDYYQRHSELNLPVIVTADEKDDFSLRHSDWSAQVSSVSIAVTGAIDLSDFYQRLQAQKLRDIRVDVSDYFIRHTDLSVSIPTVIDITSDFYVRHPELGPAEPSTDLSDYFLRH